MPKTEAKMYNSFTHNAKENNTPAPQTVIIGGKFCSSAVCPTVCTNDPSPTLP